MERQGLECNETESFTSVTSSWLPSSQVTTIASPASRGTAQHRVRIRGCRVRIKGPYKFGTLGPNTGSGKGVQIQGPNTGSGYWVRVQGPGTGSGYRVRVQGLHTGSGYRVRIQGPGTGSGYRVMGPGAGSGYRVRVQCLYTGSAHRAPTQGPDAHGYMNTEARAQASWWAHRGEGAQLPLIPIWQENGLCRARRSQVRQVRSIPGKATTRKDDSEDDSDIFSI